ncbi:MAG: LemA family protein LemA protein [Candidatus Nomurabacteria bacterium]|jgi:LemA protein|nr:LemA family protein LemA protein [Candidatus Nomurabacteria bacterium]
MTWIIIALIVIVVLWFFLTYNGFVTLRNRAEEAWADIEVQLKRRYDLIPNLVNTVKGYATHESTAFEKVTEARAKAISAQGTPAAGQAEGELSGTLKSLFAITEAYPELKANTNFLALQTELSDTENKIQAARRFYNGNVRDYNTKLDTAPANIIGHMFGFQKKNYFDLPDTDAAQQPVEVKF